MAGQDPSPQTTLLILLGASSWPHSDLGGSPAFENAKNALQAYFLFDPNGFHLPESNVLNLFDSNDSNTDILNRISNFLRNRITTKKQLNADFRDVLVYYIGHGGITRDSSIFYLAIRRTQKEYEKATSIAMDDLAERLKNDARFQRRILILDCCFAARALRFLQGSTPVTFISAKTIAAFEERDQGEGVPSRGTSFIASSGKDDASVILPDGTSTMFTSALLTALRTGDPFQVRERLTLHTVFRLTEDFLRETHGNEFPRPELHSPDQTEGKVEDIPFFPNPAAKASEPFPWTDLTPPTEKLEKIEDRGGASEAAKRGIAPPFGPGISTPSGPVNFVLQHTLTGHSQDVLVLAISPDGRTLVSGSRDKTMKIWQLPTGQLLGTIPGIVAQIFSKEVSSLAIGVDGPLLASVDQSGTISLWELPSGRRLNTIKEIDKDYGKFRFVTFSPDGSILASLSRVIRLWDPLTMELLRTLGPDPIWTESQGLQAYDYLQSLAFSPDGQILAGCGEGVIQLDSDSSSHGQVIRLWNPDTAELLDSFVGHKRDVYSVAFSSDGQVLACYGDDGDDKKYPDYLQQIRQENPARELLPPRSKSYQDDSLSRRIKSSFKDYSLSIKLWDCNTRQIVRTITPYSGNVDILFVRLNRRANRDPFAFSPDGQVLASAVSASGLGLEKSTIKLWNWHTGELLQALIEDPGRIHAITFSPDGQTLVSTYSHRIEIWGKTGAQ